MGDREGSSIFTCDAACPENLGPEGVSYIWIYGHVVSMVHHTEDGLCRRGSPIEILTPLL